MNDGRFMMLATRPPSAAETPFSPVQTTEVRVVLHSMKNVTLIGTFLLSFVAAVSAQTNGGIILRGFVPPVLDISIASERDTTGLDLGIDAPEVRLGAVVASSNSRAGYTIAIESENAISSASDTAYFRGGDASNVDTLGYTVFYGGAPVAFDSGRAEVRTSVFALPEEYMTGDLSISYAGAHTSLHTDSYSDTLVITISAP